LVPKPIPGTSKPYPGTPKPILKPLQGVIFLTSQTLLRGPILALDPYSGLPKQNFAVSESFSAVFTQDMANLDIFPFDSIVPDTQIYIKKASFLRNYLYLIAQLPHQKPNLALLNKIVGEHPI